MSLQAAIGRIDQIMQLTQQVTDPGASTTATATASAATGGSAAALTAVAPSTSGQSASFADMLAGAQQPAADATATASDPALTGLTDPITSGVSAPILSATPTTTTSPLTGATGLTGGAPAQLSAMTQEADSLLGKPYVWGGGHGDFGPQPGYDCSGFVSAVLHAGGYLSTPQDTQTLPSQPGIEAGPGQYVTIYDRTDAGSGSDHVIIDLGGQFYESGGGHGAWGGGGGVEKIGTPSAAYLASFNQILHPEGL